MSKGRQQSLSDLADGLERILSASAEDVDQIYNELKSQHDEHPGASDVLANVSHFASDVDSRAKDDDYRDMQERTMREFIRALQRGAPREELMALHFLG